MSRFDLHRRLKRALLDHRAAQSAEDRGEFVPADTGPIDTHQEPVLCSEPVETTSRRLAELNAATAEFVGRLSPSQKMAAFSDEPSILLRAHAGTGKTTTLAAYVLAQLSQSPSERGGGIIVTTYTQRAAGWLYHRLQALTKDSAFRHLQIGTIHSLARRYLNTHPELETTGLHSGFEVLDTEARDLLLAQVIRDHRLKIKYLTRLDRRLESARKGELLMGNMRSEDDLTRLIELYTSEKRRRNAADFDDLLFLSLKLKPVPGSHPTVLVIDEIQDTNTDLLDVLKLWHEPSTRFFAAGDPQQEIYSFRRGAGGVFEETRRYFHCREYTLALNYRSSGTILLAARHIAGVRSINLRGVEAAGEKIVVRRHQNAASEALHLMAWRRELLQQNPRVTLAVLVRLRVLGEELRAAILRLAGRPDGETTFTAEEYEATAAAISTIHGVKGLEFDHVVVSAANAGVVPLATRRSEEASEAEERRLFFVALTRARKSVEISWRVQSDYHGLRPEPTPYLESIPSPLLDRHDLILTTQPQKLTHCQPNELTLAEHPDYGVGQILTRDNTQVTIRFPERGERTFLIHFTPGLQLPPQP